VRAVKVNLVHYLDLIDGHLLGYLDAHEDLSVETVEHLGRYAVAMAQGLVTPEHVMEDWEDFYDLADAFVMAYGTERLRQLDWDATLLDVAPDQPVAPLALADRVFLANLVTELDGFVASRRR
jgi:hypothetical protein